jgi:hypothetical protein
MTNTQSPAYLAALVAYANTDATGGFTHEARRVTIAEFNLDVSRFVKSGAIVETPGDPYVWAVA